jgi:aminocarboxymuconate-semialdehyde decarboxylase
MQNRRDFFRTAAGAAAGFFVGNTLAGAHPSTIARGALSDVEGQGRQGGGRGGQAAPAGPVVRREVSIGGKRVRVIDVHCHCMIPEAVEVVKGTPWQQGAPAGNQVIGPQRIAVMDQQGVDIQALTVNGYWWHAITDRDLARRMIQVQNEGLAKIVAANPTRFVAMASVSLQFPEMAAEQLDAAAKLGLRGVSIGGHCNGEDVSNPKYDPFWAKCQQLGTLVFMHPGGAENFIKDGAFRGRGDLGNIIGNPLETTYFLSRLIFDGTLDKFPNLKVAGAHAGGYLPSYFGRTEVACDVRGNANCANKKRPKDYLRSQIIADTMVFSEEGLRHLVNEMGVGQIVYGTDVPFNWPVTVDLVLNASFLTNADKEAILSGNLAKLLRITT